MICQFTVYTSRVFEQTERKREKERRWVTEEEKCMCLVEKTDCTSTGFRVVFSLDMCWFRRRAIIGRIIVVSICRTEEMPLRIRIDIGVGREGRCLWWTRTGIAGVMERRWGCWGWWGRWWRKWIDWIRIRDRIGWIIFVWIGWRGDWSNRHWWGRRRGWRRWCS